MWLVSVVEKWQWNRFFFQHFLLSLSLLFHKYSSSSSLKSILTRTADYVFEHLTFDSRGGLDRKVLSNCLAFKRLNSYSKVNVTYRASQNESIFYLKLKNQEMLYVPGRKLKVNIISGNIKCMRVKNEVNI